MTLHNAISLSKTSNLSKNKMKSIFLLFLLLIISPSLALNLDGTLLLSFKYSILNDPLSALDNWNYNDDTPCLWSGITCENTQVIALTLPNSNLLGTIPEDLGLVPNLKTIDLSNNSFTGPLPQFVSGLASSLLNLSLSNNLLTGRIPGKIQSFEFLDLSKNSLSGPLPLDFGGRNLNYLNLSSNNLSGQVPPEFAMKIPVNSTVDLSFNDLSGEIPVLPVLSSQKAESFAGNKNLCGKPLDKLCSIPSTLSTGVNPNGNTSSSPAIAVLPKEMINPSISPLQDSPRTTPQTNQVSSPQHGLKPGAIVAIAIGPLALLGLFAMLYLYNRKKAENDESKGFVPSYVFKKEYSDSSSSVTTTVLTKESRNCINLSITTCLGKSKHEEEEEHTSEASIDPEHGKNYVKSVTRSLVMVDDGETELELETLFKASAYVLGSSGPSIVYKAVLQGGPAFAVRRIGEGGGYEGMKEFESRVREVAKVRHPNLVRVRGFCWGDDDEKLVIYDYVSNGSLANVGYRKIGSSPYHLPFETRLKIAKGVARGLTYIHDKKNVHGNIKPSNILLTPDMEPVISDFGLKRLVNGNKIIKRAHDSEGQERHFGSKRSISSPHDHDSVISSPSYPAPVGFVGCTNPYHAPESRDTLKPSHKWDVYSFGVLLLELLTGRVFSDLELSQCTASLVVEDPARVLRMVDASIRGDVAAREEAVLAWFKLGFRCASLAPPKRPRMRDALHVLEKLPCSH